MLSPSKVTVPVSLGVTEMDGGPDKIWMTGTLMVSTILVFVESRTDQFVSVMYVKLPSFSILTDKEREPQTPLLNCLLS